MDNYSVISLVPISDEKCDISRRIREWDRNPGPAEDSDPSKPASGLVEG